jgi:hypothetical protein
MVYWDMLRPTTDSSLVAAPGSAGKAAVASCAPHYYLFLDQLLLILTTLYEDSTLMRVECLQTTDAHTR